MIVSGFLGAGKTTLVNRILSTRHGLRVAVIVNDFGALAIPAEFVAGTTSRTTLLTNGCVCCTMQHDLVQALEEMLELTPAVHMILIEASGVTEPSQLTSLLAMTRLSQPIVVDAIITLADAELLREQEGDYGGELVVAQLRAADLVVLNKADLVTKPALEATRAWVTAAAPRAVVLGATQAAVPLELLLGLLPPHHDTRPAPACTSSSPAFDQWAFTTHQVFDTLLLQQVLGQLPAGILRGKGSVRLSDSPEQATLVQLVGRRLGLYPDCSASVSSRQSDLVLIGTPGSVDHATLDSLLSSALVSEP